MIAMLLRCWRAVVQLMPLVYACGAMLAAPVAGFMFLPARVLSYIYIAEVSVFGVVCFWVTAEAVGACISRLRTPKTITLDCWPELAYIVPAYLNNEAVVLDDTLEAYLNLDYPGSLTVLLVYNCKGDIHEVEQELKAKWDGVSRGNICIEVRKNVSSTSKAENVNYGLTLLSKAVEYIAIMDADHQPNPNNATAAVTAMISRDLDIVQGSCTIRNVNNVLSRIVAVEFEDIYNVGHEGRSCLFGLGVFGGSNGLWRSSVLQHIRMDCSMLTEDIDSSIRATLAGCKIGYCSQMISSELSPLTYSTLHKQRMRWAQGWFQVSLRHMLPVLISTTMSIRQVVACLFLLAWREAFCYIILHPLVLITLAGIRGRLTVTVVYIALGAVIFLLGLARTCITFQLARGGIRRSAFSFVFFAVVQVFWALYMSVIQVMSHAREMLHMHQWTATIREQAVAVKIAIPDGSDSSTADIVRVSLEVVDGGHAKAAAIAGLTTVTIEMPDEDITLAKEVAGQQFVIAMQKEGADMPETIITVM